MIEEAKLSPSVSAEKPLEAKVERPVKRVLFLENVASQSLQESHNSLYGADLRIRGSRLRFDAPNKKIFRDLRTLTV